MAQTATKTQNIDAAKSSADALRLLSSPADISAGSTTAAQLRSVLDALKAFTGYLENKVYASGDQNFLENQDKIVARALELQSQADAGWLKSQDDARLDLYSDILIYSREVVNKSKIVSSVPYKVEKRVPHKVTLVSGEAPKAYFSTQSPWEVEIDSLPARTANFLSDSEQPKAQKLIGGLLTPYLNYRNAKSDSERSMYAKEMAKAASSLISYFEEVNPEALGRMICGRGTDCDATISALKKGDAKAIEELLQEGNSPLAEFMDEALDSTGGKYKTSIPYLAIDPSVRVVLGEKSFVEAKLLIVGSKEITENKPRSGTGEESTYEEKEEFRFSPELNAGTKFTIPPGKESRLKLGLEGGLGAYNPYYLKKGKYVVGLRAGFSVDYEANVTDRSSLKMNLKVEGKQGLGKEAFTELLERTELIFMTFQFGKRIGLGVVARADAMQLFADSFTVPLYGINADAGLAHQLVLYKDQGGTVDIYFAGGYTHKLNKLEGLPWESSKGGWFQLNTGKEGVVSGGIDFRFYEPTEIRGLPKGKSPWQYSVGGNIGIHF